jgi:hypothetical protein
MQLKFVVPGLWQAVALWQKDFAFQAQAPSLLSLLGQAKPQALGVQGLIPTLFQFAGFTGQEIPFAYYRYRTEFGNSPETALLCADPVYLQTGIQDIVLNPQLPLLNHAQQQALFNTLQPLLAEDGLSLMAHSPNHWYLSVPEHTQVLPTQTTPLMQALGQSIYPLLARGNKRYWHRLGNELQMLLHQANVPHVNALWFWGASPLPVTHLPKQTGRVLGHSLIAQTYASATQQPYQAATQWSALDAQSDYVIVLEDLQLAALTDDMQAWQATINHYEQVWFTPALTAVTAGKAQISISACDGNLWHVQAPRRSWKFWQKPPVATWNSLSDAVKA